jgi:hypothetical protein
MAAFTTPHSKRQAVFPLDDIMALTSGQNKLEKNASRPHVDPGAEPTSAASEVRADYPPFYRSASGAETGTYHPAVRRAAVVPRFFAPALKQRLYPLFRPRSSRIRRRWDARRAATIQLRQTAGIDFLVSTMPGDTYQRIISPNNKEVKVLGRRGG